MIFTISYHFFTISISLAEFEKTTFDITALEYGEAAKKTVE